MAFQPARVTVTTTATLLTEAPDDYIKGQTVLVRNRGSASIFVGGPDVTADDGFEVQADELLSVDVDVDERLYGITASGTVLCHVLNGGV